MDDLTQDEFTPEDWHDLLQKLTWLRDNCLSLESTTTKSAEVMRGVASGALVDTAHATELAEAFMEALRGIANVRATLDNWVKRRDVM
jgi:hypothetical protein